MEKEQGHDEKCIKKKSLSRKKIHFVEGRVAAIRSENLVGSGKIRLVRSRTFSTNDRGLFVAFSIGRNSAAISVVSGQNNIRKLEEKEKKIINNAH